MSSNMDVELNARYLVLADVRFHTNQEIYEALSYLIQKKQDPRNICFTDLVRCFIALKLYIDTFGIVKEEIYRAISRCIENDYIESYYILSEAFLKNKLLPKPILIRPYLFPFMNRKLFLDAHNRLGLKDNELHTWISKKHIVEYHHKGPFEAFNENKYFGYREAWHLLVYGQKENKEELILFWETHNYDCIYSAAVDFLLWSHKIPKSQWIEFAKTHIISQSTVKDFIRFRKRVIFIKILL